MSRRVVRAVFVLVACCLCGTPLHAQRRVTPHHQDRPPGPALSPEEAVAKMTVPEGVSVEIVAAEPDIARNDWMQLLYNVFDPSQVIVPGYQSRTLVTTKGRVLTGLAVEESEQRVVLKIQVGKLETIPRAQIEEYQVSDLSMMPEQLE